MYRITLHKIGSLRKAQVTASHVEALVDHLRASAGRHGFTVTEYGDYPLPFGETHRGGVRFASWFIEEVSE